VIGGFSAMEGRGVESGPYQRVIHYAAVDTPGRLIWFELNNPPMDNNRPDHYFGDAFWRTLPNRVRPL
jgi:hypothetical protein